MAPVPGARGILKMASSLGTWHLGSRLHLCCELLQCHQRSGMREDTVIPLVAPEGRPGPGTPSSVGFVGRPQDLGPQSLRHVASQVSHLAGAGLQVSLISSSLPRGGRVSDSGDPRLGRRRPEPSPPQSPQDLACHLCRAGS